MYQQEKAYEKPQIQQKKNKKKLQNDKIPSKCNCENISPKTHS